MSNRSARAILAASLGAVLLTVAPSAQAPRWPSSSPPRPLAARETAFPPYALRTLPNGLRVVVGRHAGQPAVSLRLIVGAGTAQDAPARLGVASMVASLLDQGTTTKTARQVADTIDAVGGELETGAGRDLSFAHVVVMKDSFALATALLADVIRRPAFTDEEIGRQREQTIAALRVSYQDPDYLADAVFDRLVYGLHPYGFPATGTVDSLRRITRGDLVEFHRRYYLPNNAILAVVGDVAVDEAVAAVSGAFGDWPRQALAPPVAEGPPAPSRRVVVVDKPDAVQTEIRVGLLGIPRHASDFMAVDLAVRILGGEGANRLHRVLRTERGLTYGASATDETLKEAGDVMARTNTRSDATGEALRLIVDEFFRLWREPVDEGELAGAKAYLTGSFPLKFETPDDLATLVLNVLFYDLPVDDLQTYRQRVNAVSVDDVWRAAAKHLPPDRLSVVLVGNASAFLGQLKGVGFSRVEVVRLPDLDLASADLKRQDPAPPGGAAPGGRPGGAGRWPAGLPVPTSVAWRGPVAEAVPGLGASAQWPPASATPSRARSLIDRAIQAKGGLDHLRGVTSMKATSETTLHTPRGPVTTTTTTYIVYPDHVRVEARLPVGLAVQVYAGDDTVWVSDPDKGVFVPPPTVRADFRASARRDVLTLLLRAHDGQSRARMADLGPDEVLEPNVSAVAVSETGADPVVLYLDSTSGVIEKIAYQLADGGWAEELFDDYRDVAGVQIPYRAALRRGSLPVAERVVTSVSINVPIDPALFTKPVRR
jgi:zinc protease